MSSARRSGIRHRLPAALIAVCLLAVLSACGGGGEDQEKSADRLRVVLAAEPPTLDPISGGRTAGQLVWGTILEPLVAMDEQLRPTKDGIVVGWERSDPQTWKLTVREGLSFSNGEPADAAAVANTIELTRDSERSVLKQYFQAIDEIETPDATTVTLHMSTPRFDVPYLLTTVFLVPPKYYAEKGLEGFSAAPVGTGPYVLEKYNPGRDFSVVRNPDYWGDAAKTERIVFSWSPEPSQRLALVRSKAQDLAFNLPTSQADEAEDAGLKVTRIESAMTVVGFLQANQPPLDDPTVREAIALAIDRDQIVDGVLRDGGVANGGMLNILPGQEPAEVVSPDPARAKQLLAGKKVELPLTYPTGQYPQIDEVAKAIGGFLEEAGVKVKYQPVDYGSLVSQMIGREINGLYLIGALANAPVPDFIASGFMKSTALSGNCPVPEIDELIAEALETEDSEASGPIYDRLNTLAVVESHCYVPLYRLVVSYASQPGVEGLRFTPLNTVDFTDVTVS